DQTRSTHYGPAPMTPGSRNDRAPNSCRELVKHPIRCSIRPDNGDRIEENGNARVSRGKLNHARNRRALKQLKYSKHFVQRFFRRILKLLAHAHDQRGISEGYDFHQSVIPSEVEEIPWHNLRYFHEILR